VSRAEANLLALSFRQDKVSLAIIDQVLDALSQPMQRAA